MLCVSCRPWRKSLPGSCRNRKCSSRWAESRSALTPPPRAASPSSTPSPASTPPVSRTNLHTYAETHTHTHTHTVYVHMVHMDMSAHTDRACAAFCPHPLKTVGGCEKHFCFWTLQLWSVRFCSFCHIFTLVKVIFRRSVMKEIFRFNTSKTT